jgi:hypothetical protein
VKIVNRSLEPARDVHHFRDCPRTVELCPDLFGCIWQALAKIVVALEHLVQLHESADQVTLSTRSESESYRHGTLQRPIE